MKFQASLCTQQINGALNTHDTNAVEANISERKCAMHYTLQWKEKSEKFVISGLKIIVQAGAGEPLALSRQ